MFKLLSDFKLSAFKSLKSLKLSFNFLLLFESELFFILKLFNVLNK